MDDRDEIPWNHNEVVTTVRKVSQRFPFYFSLLLYPSLFVSSLFLLLLLLLRYCISIVSLESLIYRYLERTSRNLMRSTNLSLCWPRQLLRDCTTGDKHTPAKYISEAPEARYFCFNPFPSPVWRAFMLYAWPVRGSGVAYLWNFDKSWILERMFPAYFAFARDATVCCSNGEESRCRDSKSRELRGMS